ncbi:MAG: class I SAM-dependent methyltransferase [Pseudomonadota bacterium]
MSQADAWGDYWRKEGASGEVFVSHGEAKHPGLEKFWQDVFDDRERTLKVLDIAAGGGSIYAAFENTDRHELSACDISEAALDLLQERIPGVECEVCPADALTYPDESFDLVVSQFGVEYAGLEAFGEAARVVCDGGELRLLCHCEDGFVDNRVRGQLAGARTANESGFAVKAATLIRAIALNDEDAIKRSVAAFKIAEGKMVQAIEAYPDGIHLHLYQGFRKMYSELNEYHPDDIIGWLSNVTAEVDVAVSRLSQMRDATQDEAGIRAATDRIEAAGMVIKSTTLLQLPNHDLPLAWHIEAHKPRR